MTHIHRSMLYIEAPYHTAYKIVEGKRGGGHKGTKKITFCSIAKELVLQRVDSFTREAGWFRKRNYRHKLITI